MRASDLLGRARREDSRRRRRRRQRAAPSASPASSASSASSTADPPYFPYYSKRLDGAGRFLQSNLVQKPAQYTAQYARGVYAEAGDIASDAGSRVLSIALKCMAALAGLALTLACAVLLYAALYWFVVPQKEFNFPLYFDYGAAGQSSAAGGAPRERGRCLSKSQEIREACAIGAV